LVIGGGVGELGHRAIFDFFELFSHFDISWEIGGAPPPHARRVRPSPDLHYAQGVARIFLSRFAASRAQPRERAIKTAFRVY
jgi:hypothetical protein